MTEKKTAKKKPSAEEKNLRGFARNLKVNFRKLDLLKVALTHRSYLNEHPEYKLGHNERLEFLGDAVLELVVTDYLYRNYKNPEGELTAWRAALVNTDMLSRVASGLGVNEILRMGRGEARDAESRARHHLLANTLEAIIGAIYLDQGYIAAKKFIERNVISNLDEILAAKSWRDPKSHFQEEAQKHLGITPHYELIKQEGPDHGRVFTVGAYLGKDLVCTGTGSSKQEAQRDAARKAVKKKGWD